MEKREFSVGIRQQQEWQLLIIIALFLTGSGAGLFFLSLLPGFVLGMVLGVVSVMVGCLFLLADLTRPQAAWRLISRPQSSWMSRGVIGISSFAILALFYIFLLVSEPNGWASLGRPWSGGSAAMTALGMLVGFGALFVCSYPGFLLGTMRSISFWNGAYLPALFLVSALLGGFGVLYLLPLNWEALPGLNSLPMLGLGLVIFELLLLLGLVWLAQSESIRRSVLLLTKGELRFQFFIGVIGIGLLAPLFIMGLIAAGGSAPSLPFLEGLLHLLGVFFLRYVILRAGVQISPSF